MNAARLILIATAAALLAAAPADARPQTTATQTIVDRDGDNRLETGPGEDHVVREDLADAEAGRAKRRVERLFFGQMSDTHVVDEESPLRVEFLDRVGPFGSAYRPQEGLTPHVLDQMVKQLRNTVSPVTQRQLDLVMTTGDNTDNTQLNETRWLIDLMDGDRVVDPDSGVAGACGPEGYHGVRGDHEYYEPDSSEGEDGPGYSPREAENGRPVASRDFPGLFDRMNEPFRATGFDDLKWYAVFGNHDGLIQGNQPRNAAMDAIATGCFKPSSLSTAALTAIQNGDPEEAVVALREALEDIAANPGTPNVPSDPRRIPLSKPEWISQHFDTTGQPKGHGFSAANVATGQGNYTFSPKPGLRFVVLDTIAEHGLDDGNVDDAQFNWLHGELLAAEGRRETVLVFAHHSLRTMGQPPISPFFPPGGGGGDPNPIVHFGDGPRFSPEPLPCTKTQPSDLPDPTETVRCLLLRHPSVVAFVNGHEHNHRVDPVEGQAGQHGFWEVNTASHVDWPQHSRVLDLVDNRDGTLSLFGTVVDHAAAPEPGGGTAGDSVQRLASIGRELAFNDHQATHDERGEGGGRGGRDDRNVELVVTDPYAD